MCTHYEGLESHRPNNLYIDSVAIHSFSNFSLSVSFFSASLKRKPSFVCSKRK